MGDEKRLSQNILLILGLFLAENNKEVQAGKLSAPPLFCLQVKIEFIKIKCVLPLDTYQPRDGTRGIYIKQDLLTSFYLLFIYLSTVCHPQIFKVLSLCLFKFVQT